MAIRSAVDAIIEAADHTHQWEILGNTNSGRFRCATCGQTTTAQARQAAERLAAGKRMSDQRYTYDRGYEEGQADKKRGTKADVPFNSPHLLKKTQVQWGKGYVDGWSGKPKSVTEAAPKSSLTLTDFTTKTLSPLGGAAKAGQWVPTKTKQSVEFRSHDTHALRSVRQAAVRAGLNVTSEPLMLSTNTLKISGFLAEGSEYQGRKVTLNKPFRTPGGPKKFAVYVRNDKGNVVKVNFGDPDRSIKRDDPGRRANFRARHGCDNPGPKWKAKYWSCRFWSTKNVSDLI